ncbi:MAG: translation initiation factor IF-2 [Candidatus Aenigmarchaeota archaeon]|nr:translation initiation factor IF-2 [Candidatus Aenigmarchaeota archaeon]
MTIRQPIVAVLGHVDHGKTTILDSIRGTIVQSGEAGGITQHIGASFIPIDVIKNFCGNLLDKLKIDVGIPGLLFVDTPGHEAFTTLRRRGGSVADLAILVVDVNKGFQPQTDESLEYLKKFKTPFVVAANKIDLVPGWFPKKKACFIDTIKEQSYDVSGELEEKMYTLVAQLSERGFEAERFDRINDFRKQVAIVPCSGKTGEGVPELLMVLAGLSQQFLKGRLEVTGKAKGAVLEVKDLKGFGTTVDVIVYDGVIKIGDHLIVGGKEPIVTKVKALLRPPVLKELRIEKKFEHVKQITAAAGIKIAAPNLEGVIAGSPIIGVSNEDEIETAKKKIEKEIEEVEFTLNVDGVVTKADTLGSLEALIKMLKDNGIPIRKAGIGPVTKQDVVEADTVKAGERRVILGFNVNILKDAEELTRDLEIKTFFNNIIYQLIEDYQEWFEAREEREKQAKISKLPRPCKLKMIPGCVFRKRSPAVFGVEVVNGVIKPGTPMKVEKTGKDVGKVDQIQKEGKNVGKAKTGDKVAVSMEEPTIGRQINEGDSLVSIITRGNLQGLKEVWDKLQDDEKLLLKEWGLV